MALSQEVCACARVRVCACARVRGASWRGRARALARAWRVSRSRIYGVGVVAVFGRVVGSQLTMWAASSSVRVVKVVTVRGVPAAVRAASAMAKRTHLTWVAIPASRSAPKSRLRASSLIMQATSCHLRGRGFLAI
jgi:hypothetical protein